MFADPDSDNKFKIQNWHKSTEKLQRWGDNGELVGDILEF
jgi:hypothetical protein